MKIRSGYVSNSSSSSFCMMGVPVNYNEVKEVFERFLKENGREFNEDQFDPTDALEELGVHFYHGIYDYGGHVVGLDVGEMRGDETLDEFKQRACDSTKVFGFDVRKFGWCVDGGDDN